MSEPDPDANGVRYTGLAAFSASTTGFIAIDVLIIANTGSVPLPVSISEFTFTPNSGTPRFDAVPTADLPNSNVQSDVVVSPGTTERIALTVRGADSRDLVATWEIRGHLGHVRLPLIHPQPLPTPTDYRPNCQRP